MAEEQTSEPVAETTDTTTDGTEGTETTETTEETVSADAQAQEKAPVTESTEQTTDTAESTAEETAEAAPERVVPDVDKYVLPEGVPDYMAQFAKDNDMTQAQLDKSMQAFGGFIKGAKDQEQAKLLEEGNKHVAQWGNQSERNLSLVRRALSQNDPEGNLTTMLNETGYGNHPAVLDFFLSIGTSMQEGGFLKGSVNRPQAKQTAASSMFGKSHPSAN